MAGATVTPPAPATSPIFAGAPECARPRALPRGKTSRHRIGKPASFYEHGCGRGRPDAAPRLRPPLIPPPPVSKPAKTVKKPG